jgi:2-(1,2-epoxy-1,2-dihydrophenyl)acetyl-CoA isomerase
MSTVADAMVDIGRVLVRTEQGVRTLTLSNPAARNAVSTAMWSRLEEELTAARDDDTVRCLVLTGDVDHFCAGIEFRPDAAPTHRSQLERLRWLNRVVVALHELPVPTIAAVDGVAYGIGMNLALACDLVVATTRAAFSEVFVRRALSIDGGGSWLLPRRVGLAMAKELCLLGDPVDGIRAAELGIANRVVDPAELHATVRGLSERLAAGPPLAMAQAKRLLDDAATATFAQALEQEALAQCHNIAHPDFREAISAARDGRSPEYT